MDRLEQTRPSHIKEAEWNARCELAALYRLIAYYKMTDLIDTHISLRVPNEPEHFLINCLKVNKDWVKVKKYI